MKINFTYSLIIFSASIFLLTSCEKELPTRADYTAYEFTSTDENGGTWVPVLLANPEQIVIEAPADITSDAYQQELADLKSASSGLTTEQEAAVAYWTNNSALRWNEIALELIAKYNLIPGPNADGTYTLPNPATPEGPPPFPFAHPPYASRALAYLSVAQFDGLITAWHYKYQFNRPAPHQTDGNITAAYADNDIPSYPSDGAVIAAVSREILTAMFPLEKDYLLAKAAEQMESLQWAGVNVTSDIAAGEYIGVEVAKVAKLRASTDGMKNAQAPKAVADSIKAEAFARFGWQWNNLEDPVRPVGLAPLFGRVQLWNTPSVEAVRPPVPPAPGTSDYQAAEAELLDLAANVTVERRSIANFWSDGLGTYTPPGHWNRLAKEFIIEAKMNPIRTVRCLAYMNMALMDGGIACWDAKYYYHYPRPIQNIPGFLTILGTPNFPSYPSGHSTFSAAAAEVLAYIFPAKADIVRAWAAEAAESRVYAGIHWRFDATSGADQGKSVGLYTVDKAILDGAD